MKRILVIDDHADTLDSYSVALKLASFDCVACLTGADGVREFQKAQDEDKPFDLVITDLMLDPEDSGVSVIRKIRAICPDCRIVLATGRKDDHLAFLMKEAGVIAVWRKPIDNFRQRVEEIFSMPSDVKTDRRRSFLRRHLEALNQAKQGTLILVVLFTVLAMQIRSTWMAPKIYSEIGSISNTVTSTNEKLDGAVSTKSLPAGYRVSIAKRKDAVRVMSGGRVRLMVEFEPKDGPAAKSLGAEPGPLWLSVTREK